jgi:flagellin-like protein
MKGLISVIALALAVAFTVPAFAGGGSTPTNKADCEKAGKKWDDSGNKCVEKQ